MRAQAIVNHRTSNGTFTSVDQLTDVKGIATPMALKEVR
jgi:DNA uptake protein ComE-like DNA-binding protein